MTFLYPSQLSDMNAFGAIRAIIVGVLSLVKLTVLSVLRLGRWCWDRIHLR